MHLQLNVWVAVSHAVSKAVGHDALRPRSTSHACAGGLPLGGSQAQIAEFEYLEDAADASALRRIKFAPGLDFNALVAAIMEGVPAEPAEEGQSGAAPGTGREDAALPQQPPAPQPQPRHVSIAATTDPGSPHLFFLQWMPFT
jgi:hypothetical protein